MCKNMGQWGVGTAVVNGGEGEGDEGEGEGGGGGEGGEELMHAVLLEWWGCLCWCGPIAVSCTYYLP